MKRIDILKSQINVTNMEDLTKEIEEFIQLKKSGYICVSNIHTVVTGFKDVKLRNTTNNAFMAIPDGMPLSVLGRIKGNKDMGRCAGPDLMEKIFEISELKGYTHYFYGGTHETLELLYQNLKIRYPKLKVLGLYSPPFRDLIEEEKKRDIETINQLRPDFIWVGLGAPKQEYWMAECYEQIHSSLLIGVGAAFNFHAGTVKRAPDWMQRTSLEWLYRFMQEPRRLWKRYFITNTLFLYYLIRESFSKYN